MKIVFIILLLVVVVTACQFGGTVPSSANLTYRAVEPTGVYGTAQYYVFDDKGNRYKVSQKQFDSYINLPRK